MMRRYFFAVFPLVALACGLSWGFSHKVDREISKAALSPVKTNHNSHHSTKPMSEQVSEFHRLTVGTSEKSQMEVGEKVERPDHGVRIYCPISHFSYDDPIVFWNQPGAAHLHMFIGNTEANAYSTPDFLVDNGKSTCEGGTNIRSSYWVPALLSQSGEAVVPEDMFIYYKSEKKLHLH